MYYFNFLCNINIYIWELPFFGTATHLNQLVLNFKRFGGCGRTTEQCNVLYQSIEIHKPKHQDRRIKFQIWISLQIIDSNAFEWTEFGRSHYCAILKKEHLNLVHWVQCFRAAILCENVLQASKWDLTWWGVWSFSSCFKVSTLEIMDFSKSKKTKWTRIIVHFVGTPPL